MADRMRSSHTKAQADPPAPVTLATALALTPRIRWSKVAVALAFTASLLISRPLWLSSRWYALTPVFDSLPPLPPPVDGIVLGLVALLLLATAFVPRPKWWLTATLVLLGVLGLGDQSRWQPWAYQFTAMLAALLVFVSGEEKAKNQKALLGIYRLILVCTYVWSGFQKTNAGFSQVVVPFLLSPFPNLSPRLLTVASYTLAIVIPVAEITLGLMLATQRARKIALFGLLGMHGGILCLLIYLRANPVVWPWNLAMMCLLVLLFWETPELTFKQLFTPPKPLFYKLLYMLFCLFPALSFAGWWDAYLSLALYSGNTIEAKIYVSEAVIKKLPPELQPVITTVTQFGEQRRYIDLNKWAYLELKTPLYPETRICRKVAQQLCQYGTDPQDVVLTTFDKPRWPDGAVQRSFCDCAMLQQGKPCQPY